MLNIYKFKCNKCGYKSEFVASSKPTKDDCPNCHPIDIHSNFSPSWLTPLKELNKLKDMDAKGESAPIERMQAERAREIRISTKARAWEAARRKELADYKPIWVKKGRSVKELLKIKQ